MQDVLFDTKNHTIYTPNTNQTVKFGEFSIDKQNQNGIMETRRNDGSHYTKDEHGRFTGSTSSGGGFGSKTQPRLYSNGGSSGIFRKNKDIVDGIKNGSITKKLNHEKQAPHILNSDMYKKSDNKSYFTISEKEIQALVDKYYGTGRAQIGKNGIANAKEIITVGYVIGRVITAQGVDLGETKSFKIHYSKQRTHAVPVKD